MHFSTWRTFRFQVNGVKKLLFHLKIARGACWSGMKMRNITAGPFDAIDVEPWPELRQVSAFHKILIQIEFPETSPTPYTPPQNHPKAFKHYITLKLFFFLLWDDEPFMASISEFQITKSVSLITWGGRGNRCHLLRSRPSAASHLPLQYYHIIKCDA